MPTLIDLVIPMPIDSAGSASLDSAIHIYKIKGRANLSTKHKAVRSIASSFVLSRAVGLHDIGLEYIPI